MKDEWQRRKVIAVLLEFFLCFPTRRYVQLNLNIVFVKERRWPFVKRKRLVLQTGCFCVRRRLDEKAAIASVAEEQILVNKK